MVELDRQHEIGLCFKDELIPLALEYYLGVLDGERYFAKSLKSKGSGSGDTNEIAETTYFTTGDQIKKHSSMNDSEEVKQIVQIKQGKIDAYFKNILKSTGADKKKKKKKKK